MKRGNNKLKWAVRLWAKEKRFHAQKHIWVKLCIASNWIRNKHSLRWICYLRISEPKIEKEMSSDRLLFRPRSNKWALSVCQPKTKWKSTSMSMCRREHQRFNDFYFSILSIATLIRPIEWVSEWVYRRRPRCILCLWRLECVLSRFIQLTIFAISIPGAFKRYWRTIFHSEQHESFREIIFQLTCGREHSVHK